MKVVALIILLILSGCITVNVRDKNLEKRVERLENSKGITMFEGVKISTDIFIPRAIMSW